MRSFRFFTALGSSQNDTQKKIGRPLYTCLVGLKIRGALFKSAAHFCWILRFAQNDKDRFVILNGIRWLEKCIASFVILNERSE